MRARVCVRMTGKIYRELTNFPPLRQKYFAKHMFVPGLYLSGGMIHWKVESVVELFFFSGLKRDSRIYCNGVDKS